MTIIDRASGDKYFGKVSPVSKKAWVEFKDGSRLKGKTNIYTIGTEYFGYIILSNPDYDKIIEIDFRSNEEMDGFGIGSSNQGNNYNVVFGKNHKIFDPESVIWSEIGYKNLKDEKWAETIRATSVAILKDPYFPNSYINRAWAYAEKGFFSEAISDCNQALKLSPDSVRAYNNRGLTYYKMGESKLAIADFKKACGLGFNVACDNYVFASGFYNELIPRAIVEQGKESFFTQNWDLVIHQTTEALKFNPDNELAYTIRSGAKANKGLLDEAIKDADKALSLNPDFGIAYNNKGYIYELMGKEKEALLNYEISCGLKTPNGCNNFKRYSVYIEKIKNPN
ncbi:MAG: tetratricopeptide repeat protein [Desulfobacterales bacterium]|nr:tetratricopeptide repeat protein [Desulfobacterales bacterium]